MSGPRPRVRAAARRRLSPAGAGRVAYGSVPDSQALIGDVSPGVTGSVTVTVADADTAIAVGSGDVPVLATPRVVALCEQAAIVALGPSLVPERTSVGMRVQIDHLAPTEVGGEVVAEATLERIEGRRLTFTVSVNDARGLVAAGKVTRVVVDREQFMAKATG